MHGLDIRTSHRERHSPERGATQRAKVPLVRVATLADAQEPSRLVRSHRPHQHRRATQAHDRARRCVSRVQDDRAKDLARD